MGLCREEQVVIPTHVHMKLKGDIDEDYVDRHCTGK